MSTIEKIIEGQLVAWDRKKAAINKQKHGVSFDTAALIFADVLFVVYTERGEAVRLITARAATSNERREYYGR